MKSTSFMPRKNEIKQKFRILDDGNIIPGMKYSIEERVTVLISEDSEDAAVTSALKMAAMVIEKGIKPSRIESVEQQLF